MKIYSVNDKEFAAYGKVHTGYDVSDLLSALDKSTPLPDAVGYVPSEAALENTKLFGLLQNNAYGGMPIQLGWCNGHNTKLNCLEYHHQAHRSGEERGWHRQRNPQDRHYPAGTVRTASG